MFLSFIIFLFIFSAAFAAPSGTYKDYPKPSHDYNPEDNMTTVSQH